MLICPELPRILVVNAHGVFSAHVAHKTVELPAKDWCKAGGGLKKNFLGVLVAGMANNQLPPSLLVQWGACSSGHLPPLTRHPLQDFGPEMGGIYPRVGVYPDLYGTLLCPRFIALPNSRSC